MEVNYTFLTLSPHGNIQHIIEEEQIEQISSPSTGDKDISTLESELIILRQALQDYDYYRLPSHEHQ